MPGSTRSPLTSEERKSKMAMGGLAPAGGSMQLGKASNFFPLASLAWPAGNRGLLGLTESATGLLVLALNSLPAWVEPLDPHAVRRALPAHAVLSCLLAHSGGTGSEVERGTWLAENVLSSSLPGGGVRLRGRRATLMFCRQEAVRRHTVSSHWPEW